MEREIPGGFIQVETDPRPDKMGSVKVGEVEHLPIQPLPYRSSDLSTANHFEQNLPGATIPAPPSPYLKWLKGS